MHQAWARFSGIILSALILAAACAPAPATTPAPTPATPPPAAPAPPADLVARGKEVFLRGTTPSCATCHTIKGIPGAVGTMGPELTKIGTVAATRKPGLSAEAYIRESLLDPNAFVVEGFPPAMPPGTVANLSKEDLDALVAFLLSLK